MALKPEHRQEEWYQQMINAATGKYLPSITSQDAGKVMTVESDGSWGVENVPTELPSTTSASAGDVLSLNNDKEAVWTTPSSGGLPPVTESDVGKVLAVDNSGEWGAQEPIGKKFIVTLTPTEQDFSGTMDKTVAEINAAYEAGQHIVFRTMMSATTHMDVDCTARWHTDTTYPSFNGFIISSDNGGALIFAFTGATNDGTRATYSAAIYTITPAT